MSRRVCGRQFANLVPIDDDDKTRHLNRAELFAKYAHLGFPDPATTAPSSATDRTSSPAPAEPNAPGYTLLSHVGTGGMGHVYRARRDADGLEVALKILTPYAAETLRIRGRFAREIRLLEQVDHPNIVTIIDADADPPVGRPWLALEYCPGGSLRTLLRAHPEGLQPPRALEIVRQVGAALQHLHDQGVVHRDLKPDNVLLDRHGAAKLSDLGIAQSDDTEGEDATLTLTGDVLGTRGYLAPEQRAGNRVVGPQADVWALGGLAWELMTGKVADDVHILGGDVRLKVRDALGLRVVEAIQKCREPEVGCRWPSVESFLAQLPA